MSREHTYRLRTTWTGNLGSGTSDYRAYSRNHEISVDQKPVIAGSSDPAFRGDRQRYNPEEMLVASLSACHMLWFLHFSAEAGIVVTAYVDDAEGSMAEHPDGAGEFTSVMLKPRVTITDPSRAGELDALHQRAHHFCFIARSVRFPVHCQASVAEAAG